MFPLAARGGQVTFYGAEVPPLILENKNGGLSGFAVDILHGAVEATGGELPEPVIRNMPWARSLSECRTNPQAALLVMAMLPDRVADFKWVGPIAWVNWGLYAMKSSGIMMDKPEDLAEYRIGVVRSTAPTVVLPEFFGKRELRLEQVNNIRASIRMMRVGRLDLTVQAEPGFSQLLREMDIPREEFVKVYDLKPLEMYFAFNRDVDDAYVEKLRAGLEVLQQRPADGGASRYEVLCRKYWPEGFGEICLPAAR